MLENFDGETFEEFNRKGTSPQPSTIVTIGSETRNSSITWRFITRLMTYFIQGATDEGDVVLDPFSGTGTTSVIAQALNRHYIAFDISKEYVEFGRNRVKSGPYLKEYQKKETEPNVPKLSDFGQSDE